MSSCGLLPTNHEIARGLKLLVTAVRHETVGEATRRAAVALPKR